MRWNNWKLCAGGVLLVILWLACWAASVVPGSPAVTLQWAGGNALAFLAGGAFAAASLVGRRGAPL